MRRCAFLTLSDPADYVMDDELAQAPLAALGWAVETLPWDRAGVDWRGYEAVVIRSTWDYQHHAARFLATLEAIAAVGTPLENPVPLVRWNLEKSYLRELESRGVPIVPTLWADGLQPGGLQARFRELGSAEAVIKPQLSATAQGAWRLDAEAVRRHGAEIEAYYAGRPLLLQPFVEGIVGDGEYSLFYFNGEYSHAIRKRPKPADFRVQEEHGGLIEAVAPGAGLAAAGTRVMQSLPEPPLYARVDLVRAPGGGWWLMELELIEPSLYLRMDEAAPARFAEAMDRRFGKGARR